MSETYPVATTPDRPEFTLTVDGAEVDPVVQLDVVEIDVTEEVGRHGRAVLLLHNFDDEQQEPTHSESGSFAPGTAIQIALGYAAERSTVFDGVVVGLQARFRRDTGPTLEVQCASRSILLDAAARSWTREDVSDGDVAAELASDHGLRADTAAGVTQPAVVSHRQTDWQWLVDRARRLGYVTYVRGDTLVFREPASATSSLPSLAWGRTLLELDLRQDLAGRHDPAEARGWELDELAPVTSEASAADSALSGGERPTPAGALADAGWDRPVQLPTASPLDPLEIERLAVAHADRQVLHHLAGWGRTIGLPDLSADSWIAIEAVGSRFAGPHYVTAIRHRLGRRGFTTEFQLGLPEPLLPPCPSHAASGLLLGIVEDLDDPAKQARVKVSFPWLDDRVEPVWARLATLDAGPEMGTLFVPDVGQEVVVAHIDADERHPVVLGAVWNGKQPPPLLPDPNENAIRSITSRTGHVLTFDDADPGGVTVETSGGRTLVLSDADEHVRLVDASRNSITIDGDGITLEASAGDVVLKAPAGKVKVDTTGIEMSSTGPAKLESTATLDLKASGSLSVTGSLVRIN